MPARSRLYLDRANVWECQSRSAVGHRTPPSQRPNLSILSEYCIELPTGMGGPSFHHVRLRLQSLRRFYQDECWTWCIPYAQHEGYPGSAGRQRRTLRFSADVLPLLGTSWERRRHHAAHEGRNLDARELRAGVLRRLAPRCFRFGCIDLRVLGHEPSFRVEDTSVTPQPPAQRRPVQLPVARMAANDPFGQRAVRGSRLYRSTSPPHSRRPGHRISCGPSPNVS